jgi:hypothetical protein
MRPIKKRFLFACWYEDTGYEGLHTVMAHSIEEAVDLFRERHPGEGPVSVRDPTGLLTNHAALVIIERPTSADESAEELSTS